jgi:HEAT repeat protein
MIEYAFASDDDDWMISALFAMGRSADKRWTGDVVRMLDNENPLIRLEAARAAGELEIKRTRTILIEMLNDPDDDVRAAAIWSLSQIGGQGVAEALENWMDDNDDAEEVSLIEEALDNCRSSPWMMMTTMMTLFLMTMRMRSGGLARAIRE